MLCYKSKRKANEWIFTNGNHIFPLSQKIITNQALQRALGIWCSIF